jgi:hypothetical protein
MSKKPAVKKPSPAKKTKPAPAARKNDKPARATASSANRTSTVPVESATAQSAAAQRVYAFTFDVGPSDDGDRIVEVPYPLGVEGEVLAIIFQPARAAGDIPDDWTEQHAVQLLRFSRKPAGSATVRIHRIDGGWIGQGWAGNLVLHVLVVAHSWSNVQVGLG